MSGVTCMKSGFGFVITGMSLGCGSTSIVIVPALGEGEGVAESSLSSLSSSELGVGDGVGDGVAFGEPLGVGLGDGILKATLHVYCWARRVTVGHFMPLGPCDTAYCASLGAMVAPGLLSSSCPFIPTVGPALLPLPLIVEPIAPP